MGESDETSRRGGGGLGNRGDEGGEGGSSRRLALSSRRVFVL